MLLLIFAFLAGLVTILAPCIWPVLPIVLSSSAVGKSGHQRPLGITLGVMLSFAAFTLSASYLIRIFHLDPNILRIIAAIIIGFLGLSMVLPVLGRQVELLIGKLSGFFGQKTASHGGGFLPGFITGLSLGIVWSPCAGPILATIATLAATGQVNLWVVLVTISYVIGVGIPLFAFAYGGQHFINRARMVSKYTGRIQQVFGVVMIAAALAIYTNFDQTIQLQLLNTFPQLGTTINSFEQSSAVKQQLDLLKGTTRTAENTAPEFAGVTKWLNTPNSISLKDLRGKVVLVDFWTYTCINCIRTLPHVTSWYDKYKDNGFVVIGVHTPEFAFEKDTANVETAIKRFNIHYPVAQDNDYSTWNAYNNQYWPAEYLIDSKGVIQKTEFGEGNYDDMEMAIRDLLKEASGKNINTPLDNLKNTAPVSQISPESYLGAKRMEFLDAPGMVTVGQNNYTLNEKVSSDHFSFGGEWNITGENAVAVKNSVLDYNFNAGHVYLVMRPGTVSGQVAVLLDGKPIETSVSGKDVVNGVITINQDRLYDLVDLKGKTENHLLRLEFKTPGVEAFAFTFG